MIVKMASKGKGMRGKKTKMKYTLEKIRHPLNEHEKCWIKKNAKVFLLFE